MKLDSRTLRLIAVGASISANCQACLHINIARALENGADAQDIQEAISVGKMVRQGAAAKMDDFAEQAIQPARAVTGEEPGDCDCQSRASERS